MMWQSLDSLSWPDKVPATMCEVGLSFETVTSIWHVQLRQYYSISYYKGPPTSREITLIILELLDMLLSFNQNLKEEKSRGNTSKCRQLNAIDRQKEAIRKQQEANGWQVRSKWQMESRLDFEQQILWQYCRSMACKYCYKLACWNVAELLED